MSKNTLLRGLYPITPNNYKSDIDFEEKIINIIKSGIKIFQFRSKNLSNRKNKSLFQIILRSCYDNNVALIINDNIELVKKYECLGLHIGNNDENIKKARNILGSSKIIGVSCYDSLESAIKAERYGASYVSFGSIFPTQNKANYVLCDLEHAHKIREKINVPICLIGGININNIHEVYKVKPDMISMISGIFTEHNQKNIDTMINIFNE